jgi:hypothetical protein
MVRSQRNSPGRSRGKQSRSNVSLHRLYSGPCLASSWECRSTCGKLVQIRVVCLRRPCSVFLHRRGVSGHDRGDREPRPEMRCQNTKRVAIPWGSQMTNELFKLEIKSNVETRSFMNAFTATARKSGTTDFSLLQQVGTSQSFLTFAWTHSSWAAACRGMSPFFFHRGRSSVGASSSTWRRSRKPSLLFGRQGRSRGQHKTRLCRGQGL